MKRRFRLHGLPRPGTGKCDSLNLSGGAQSACQVSSLVARFQTAANHQEQAVKRDKEREAHLSSRRSSSSSHGQGIGIEAQVTGGSPGGGAPNWRAGLRSVSGGSVGAGGVVPGVKGHTDKAAGVEVHAKREAGNAEEDEEEVLQGGEEAVDGDEAGKTVGKSTTANRTDSESKSSTQKRVGPTSPTRTKPAEVKTPSKPGPTSPKSTKKSTPAAQASGTASPDTRKRTSSKPTSPTTVKSAHVPEREAAPAPAPAPASAPPASRAARQTSKSPETKLAHAPTLSPSPIRTKALSPSHTGGGKFSALTSASPLKPQITGTPTRPTASSLAKTRSSIGPTAATPTSAGLMSPSPLIQQRTGGTAVRSSMTSPPSAYKATGLTTSSAERGSMTLGRKAGGRMSMPPAILPAASASVTPARSGTVGRKSSISGSPAAATAASTPGALKARPRTSLGNSSPASASKPAPTTPLTPAGSRLLQGTASSRAKAAAAAAATGAGASAEKSRTAGQDSKAKLNGKHGSPLKARVRVKVAKPPGEEPAPKDQAAPENPGASEVKADEHPEEGTQDVVQEEKDGQSAAPAALVQQKGPSPPPSATEPPQPIEPLGHMATPVAAGSPPIEAAPMSTIDAEPENAQVQLTPAQLPPKPSKTESDLIDGRKEGKSEEAQEIQHGEKEGGSEAGGADDGEAVPAKIIGRLGLPAVYVPPSAEEHESAGNGMGG